jgi:hypothetical protein
VVQLQLRVRIRKLSVVLRRPDGHALKRRKKLNQLIFSRHFPQMNIITIVFIT